MSTATLKLLTQSVIDSIAGDKRKAFRIGYNAMDSQEQDKYNNLLKATVREYFIKNYSSQVLKANMRIVGATEQAIVLYRDKLPKFRNHGKMVFNWINWEKDKGVKKIHPTQKPIAILKKLISIFTDEGDIVIDPVAGSGTTLRAAQELSRHSYGFEIDKNFYKLAQEQMLNEMQVGFQFEQSKREKYQQMKL